MSEAGPPRQSMDEAPPRRALVIGGGIAGISAALDLANAGVQTLLVERLPSIGGRMLQLSETFPTLDCAQCTLTPKTVETGRHPLIRLLTRTTLDSLVRDADGFRITLRRLATGVDWDKCTGCGLCQQKCPVKVPSRFECGIGTARAIGTLSPQAVPNKPVIDASACRFMKDGKCGLCRKLCPVGAIDYHRVDTLFEERVDVVVVAVGYDLMPIERFPEYAGGNDPDVIDGLAFERLNSASGPTAGELRRPSDGRVPQHVVFIQCCGSRDPQRHLPYCSRVCCMYTAKHARLYRHKVHEGRASIFFMDVRATGKGYEEFIQQGMADDHVVYLRGRVSGIRRENDRLVVDGVDTVAGRQVEIAADMVVLATGIVPAAGSLELAERLGIEADANGFFTEKHRAMGPAETGQEGIFIAGCCQGPRDIADAVAHGNAAAGRALTWLERRGAAVERG